MLVFLVERGRVFNVKEQPVDPHTAEPGLLPFGQFAAIFALATADHWRQQIGARALWQGHDPVNHLAHRLGCNRQASRRRIGNTNPRP